MTHRNSSAFGSAALAIAGTAVQVVEKCASDPVLAASLIGAAAGAWLGPLSLVAGAVAGFGVNRLASAFDRSNEAQRAARELLTNQDIARVQTAALQARIERVRDGTPRWHAYRRYVLRDLATTVQDWWPQVVQTGAQEWLNTIRDEHVSEALALYLTKEQSSPDPAAWLSILSQAAPQLDATGQVDLAGSLAQHFIGDMFEALKSDSRAFASVVLRFLAQILVEIRKEPASGLSPPVEQLVERLGHAAHALSIVEQIPQELKALVQVASQARDAAIGAQEASQRTYELIEKKVQPARRIPIQLPPAAQAFFGRAGEVARLITLLRDPHPTCYVVGIPGIGKTALAAEAVTAILNAAGRDLATTAFFDGVVFLDAYFLKSPDAIWSRLAELFDPALLQKPPRQAATSACLGKRLLVILEGAEELDDPHDVLSVVDREGKRLVLTRNRAQVEAARSVFVADVLNADDALLLLRSLAPNVPAEFLRQVHERLGGHPYALTMAGNALGTEDESPASFLRDLQAQEFPVLNAAGDPQHTLQWLFARGLHLLDEDTRALLAALGVLALGPVPLSAAQAILTRPHEQQPRTALRNLVRHSWIRVVDEGTWQFTHALSYRFARALKGPTAVLEAARVWVRNEMRSTLDAVRTSADLPAVRAAAAHATAAVIRMSGPAEDDRLLKFMLYDLHNRLEELGLLETARATITAAAARLELIEPAERTDNWQLERSLAWIKLGHVQHDQGDLAGAHASYEASRAICELLARADPSNAGLKSDLSVSLDRLGDVQRDQGDLAGARASYEASRAICVELLTRADFSNARRQRNLSVSLIKLGHVQLAQGDLAGARTSYEASRAICESLVEADPSNAGWQRDLSVSLDGLGGVQLAQGDLAGARTSYEASRAICESLVRTDPSNARWQRNLAVTHGRLGDLSDRAANPTAARASFTEGLRIVERLNALDSTNVEWRNDVRWFRARLAKL